MTNTNKFLPKELQRIISEQTGCDMMQNLDCRKRIFVQQRQIYSLILRDKGYTLASIGSSIHKRHSSMSSSIVMANNLIATSKEYKRLYEDILADLEDAINTQECTFFIDYQDQLNEIKTKLENQIINISIIINELKNKK